jgi:hypothetical protein
MFLNVYLRPVGQSTRLFFPWHGKTLHVGIGGVLGGSERPIGKTDDGQIGPRLKLNGDRKDMHEVENEKSQKSRGATQHPAHHQKEKRAAPVNDTECFMGRGGDIRAVS